MKQIVLLLVVLLSGCSVNISHNTRLYIVCYKEDTLISVTGQWLSNELYYKCDKRRALGFQTNLGKHNTEIDTDFQKKD